MNKNDETLNMKYYYATGRGQFHQDGPRNVPVAQHRETLLRGIYKIK